VKTALCARSYLLLLVWLVLITGDSIAGARTSPRTLQPLSIRCMNWSTARTAIGLASARLQPGGRCQRPSTQSRYGDGLCRAWPRGGGNARQSLSRTNKPQPVSPKMWGQTVTAALPRLAPPSANGCGVADTENIEGNCRCDGVGIAHAPGDTFFFHADFPLDAGFSASCGEVDRTDAPSPKKEETF